MDNSIKRFYRIKEKSTLIDRAKFTPSAERTVINSFETLNVQEQLAFTALARNDNRSRFDSLDTTSKNRVTNVLLQFKQFKKTGNEEDNDVKQSDEPRQKYQYLLNDPGANKESDLAPPTAGHKPSLFNISMHRLSQKRSGLSLGVSGAYHDLINRSAGHPLDSEFIVLDSRLLITDDKIEVDQFIFAKVSKYLTNKNRLFGNQKLSWKLELGHQAESTGLNFHGAYLKASAGKSRYFGKTLYFAFVDANYHEFGIYEDKIGFDFVVGALFRSGDKFSGLVELSQALNLSSKPEPYLNLSTRYSLTTNSELRINLSLAENLDGKATVSFYRYW